MILKALDSGYLKKKFLQFQWGGNSLVALCVSVFSGIVLSLQYNPAEPYFSVNSIDIMLPFGAFWRSLHFYSSQLFFLLSLVHLTAIFISGYHIQLTNWLRLIGSLPVLILLLFTGYVLRADATGESAGIIAENIVLSVPYLGNVSNELLFAISTEGLKRVYANHMIGLCVLWLVLSWDHVRRYSVVWRQHGVLLVGLFVFCLLLDAPMEPHHPGVFHIAGPWFFLGMQELLRYIQPFWAGIVFPVTLLAALAVMLSEKWRRYAVAYVFVWLGGYSVLTFFSLIR
ncbi:MAG: cytochrome b N-terminal domain-containing protein [Desulfobulbaceae bacterium]|nr:cytochrome b N-terminal domain-containing protein [Desulfobulbaceae bacterium]